MPWTIPRTLARGAPCRLQVIALSDFGETLLNMRSPYTDSFREQALEKVYNRGDASIVSVAEQLDISHWTLKYWMKSRQSNSNKGASRKTPGSARANVRSPAERMQLLLDAHTMAKRRCASAVSPGAWPMH